MFPDPKSVTNRATSITITGEIQRGTPSNTLLTKPL
jgi:hypothetical protein